MSSVFTEIAKYDRDVISLALGRLAPKTLDFLSVIDPEHPGIQEIIDGHLSNGSVFASTLLEILQLADYAKSKNLQFAKQVLGKAITKCDGFYRISKSLDNPSKNQLHVRLVKDPELRTIIRRTKKCSPINLCSHGKQPSLVSKQFSDIWYSTPDNFVGLCRNGNYYKEQVELAQKKAEHYLQFGLQSLHDEIQNSIAGFKNYIGDCYYGFNKVNCLHVCFILAKMMGLSLDDKSEIKLSTTNFEGYDFLGTRNVMRTCGPYSLPWILPTQWRLLPRLYPFHELMHVASKETSELVADLDNSPLIGNRSLFDHYWVLVPGIEYPTHDYPSFLDEEGNLRRFTDIDFARKELDCTLIRLEYLQPVLLGEKDTTLYLLSNAF